MQNVVAWEHFPFEKWQKNVLHTKLANILLKEYWQNYESLLGLFPYGRRGIITFIVTSAQMFCSSASFK